MFRRVNRARPGLPVPLLVALTALCLPPACGRVGYDLSASKSGAGGAEDTSIVLVDSGARDASASGSSSDAGTVTGSGGAAGSGTGGRASASGGSGASTGSGGARPDAGSTVDAASRDTGPACKLGGQALADWCTEVPELPAPPVIDGELECGLITRLVAPQAYNLTSTPDSTVEYAIAWSADGLYFYAAVHDPVILPAPMGDPPWEGDSLELYVDSDGVYGAPPAYDAATRQLVIAAPDGAMVSTRAEVYAVPPTGVAWTSKQFAAYPRPDGYVVEAVVTAADLGLASWPLAAGSHIGFDLGLNVSAETADGGTQGTRIGQYFLRVDPSATGHPFQNVAAFCNPALVVR